MKNWLKKRLRAWLGIDSLESEIKDLVNIGVDVHFTHPHMILIYSRLKGGQLRHIDAQFNNIAELNAFVTELRRKFNTRITTWDAPPNLRREWL
jgi:hypothetical protein